MVCPFQKQLHTLLHLAAMVAWSKLIRVHYSIADACSFDFTMVYLSSLGTILQELHQIGLDHSFVKYAIF